jgi:hypothetical protein
MRSSGFSRHGAAARSRLVTENGVHSNDSPAAPSQRANYRQLRITFGLPVIRPESAARVSTLTSIWTKSLQPQLDYVGFELLRRSEQPTAVVHETICEQVHW